MHTFNILLSLYYVSVVVPLNTGIMIRANKYNMVLEDIVRMNKEGYMLRDIANHYGCKYQVLQSWLKNRDTILIKHPVNSRVDHSFFSNIDNELKAYLLGFFAADGCVYNSYRFGLCLAEQDIEIINLYKEAIYPEAYIKKVHNTKGAVARQPQILLRISSTKIVKDLYRYGIGCRKTYSDMVVSDLIPKDLVRHFIRGYFDGDGCVSIHTKKSGNQSLRINISNGSNPILKSISSILESIKIVSYVNRRVSINEYFTLEINRKKSINIFYNYLYNNSNFYLSRKLNKFKSYYGNIELTSDPKELLAA